MNLTDSQNVNYVLRMDIAAHISNNSLDRSEICRKAGISRSYLSMIESGERNAGPNKVVKLAAALGVTVRELRPDLANLFSEGSQ